MGESITAPTPAPRANSSCRRTRSGEPIRLGTYSARRPVSRAASSTARRQASTLASNGQKGWSARPWSSFTRSIPARATVAQIAASCAGRSPIGLSAVASSGRPVTPASARRPADADPRAREPVERGGRQVHVGQDHIRLQRASCRRARSAAGPDLAAAVARGCAIVTRWVPSPTGSIRSTRPRMWAATQGSRAATARGSSTACSSMSASARRGDVRCRGVNEVGDPQPIVAALGHGTPR